MEELEEFVNKVVALPMWALMGIVCFAGVCLALFTIYA